jgi:hypothetical protein
VALLAEPTDTHTALVLLECAGRGRESGRPRAFHLLRVAAASEAPRRRARALALPDRPFVGAAAIDPRSAVLMANLARVRLG